MLRRAVLIVGALSLVAGVFCLRSAPGVAHWLLWQGGVLVLVVLFERWRYTPARLAGTRGWLPTGERFEDPTSGKLVEVYFNPETGERDYREQDEPGS